MVIAIPPISAQLGFVLSYLNLSLELIGNKWKIILGKQKN